METEINPTTEANTLKPDDKDDNMDVVPTTAQPVEAVPSSSTVTTFTDTELMANKTSEANETNESDDELIDAVFIPSQFVDTLTDETMDPSDESPPAVVDDDELDEAEIAPIIDTGKSPPMPRANIELVDNLDESAQRPSGEDDEVKNLSARLADELLFLGIAKENQTPSALPLTSSPIIDNEKAPFEETLNGAPTLGIGMNNEMTTEESIEYDLNEAKMDRNSDETSKNADYDSISPGTIPSSFVAEKQTLEPPPIPIVAQQPQQKPSIYIDFMNRLKYAPPIVDLSVDNSNRPKYSHSPFDLTSAIQNANQRFTSSVTSSSQPTFTTDDRRISATAPATTADMIASTD